MDNKIIDTLRKRFPTAKIMPDLLAEAQHSTVRIFEVMKAITEKKDKLREERVTFSAIPQPDAFA